MSEAMRPLQTPASPSSATSRLARSLAALLALTFAALLHAADAPKVTFDLPADSAEKALKRFSEQSGQEVLFASDLTKGIKCNPVHGEMTPADALNAMLSDTGLVAVQEAKSGAFSVRPEWVDEAKNVNRAIAESSKSVRPEKQARTDLDANGEPIVKLDTFEVFGRKTLNMDIQRTRDDVQPYVVFDRATIESSGATSLNDFFRTRLPMNTMQQSNEQSANPAFTSAMNTSRINLRGLGSNQTLILVDGRRMPSTSGNMESLETGSYFFRALIQPDINGIPLSAIERIDVLPSTASGIYGGGAVGGVINIILKKQYSGGELSITYGDTFDRVSSYRQYTLSGGYSSKSGNTRVMVAASHQDTRPLLIGDRVGFLERSRGIAIQNSSFPSPVFIPAGYTSNIVSNTIINGVRQPLVLRNGTPLNSVITSVPTGYGGPGTDAGAALVTRAGTFNVGFPNDYTNGGLRRSLLNNPTIDSAGVTIQHTFTRALDAYIDLAWDRNRGKAESLSGFNPNTSPSGGVQRLVLAANAPANPFNQAIIVAFPSPGLDPGESVSDSINRKIRGGVILAFGPEWKGDFDQSWSMSRLTSSENSRNIGALAGPAILADFQNGTLNPFRDVNLYPFNYNAYIGNRTPAFSGPFDVILVDSNLRAAGPIFRGPFGAFTLSSSLERRNEIMKGGYVDSAILTGGASQGSTYFTERSQLNYSVYSELNGKLYKGNNDHSVVRAINAQMAVRYDKYVNRVPNQEQQIDVPSRTSPLPPISFHDLDLDSPSYTLGLALETNQGITVRTSYGTGFLPPGPQQQAPFVADGSYGQLGNVLDPRRGNTIARYDAFGADIPGTLHTIAAGNPNLKPERSKSISVGLVVEPDSLSGFRLSADFTKIRKSDEIYLISRDQVIALEAQLPGRIQRGQNLPGDLPGWAGPIVSIDSTNVNINKSSVEAFDFQADYSHDYTSIGNLKLYAIGTLQTHRRQQVTPNTDTVELVGLRDGPLKWRGNVGAQFTHGRLTFGWNMQYYGRYSIYASTDSAATKTQRNIQGSDHVPDQRYHDVFISVNTGPRANWIVSDLQLSVSVQNVFNTWPPADMSASAISVLGGGNPDFSLYGDPRLRRFLLTIKKQF